MKKLFVFLMGIMLVENAQATQAWTSMDLYRGNCGWTTCDDDDTYTYLGTGQIPQFGSSANCSSSEVKCNYSDDVMGRRIHAILVSCTMCPGASRPEEKYLYRKDLSLYGCSAPSGEEVRAETTYGECACDCGGNCKTDLEWKAAGAGYERQITASTCNTKTCQCDNTYNFQCAAGYYGNPGNKASGCTKCPDGPNGETATSPAGSKNVTDCSIRVTAETEFKDDIGSGHYSDAATCPHQ
ncbi:hypothetical protein HDR63_02625 [bacterium]|nr:hypothetical protein [bacterium]